MQIGSLTLTKPWGVLVRTGLKTVLKEFDTEIEAMDFGRKLESFEKVQEFEIVERKTRGIYGRATSDAFVKVEAKNCPEGFYYKCIPVRPLKGYLFCTECHDYRKFKTTTDVYGMSMKCCPECGIGVNDYYIKTANNLWPKK